jgi:hypothetical protein
MLAARSNGDVGALATRRPSMGGLANDSARGGGTISQGRSGQKRKNRRLVWGKMVGSLIGAAHRAVSNIVRAAARSRCPLNNPGVEGMAWGH